MLLALDVGNSSISIGVFRDCGDTAPEDMISINGTNNDADSCSDAANMNLQKFASAMVCSSKISVSLARCADEYSILFLNVLTMHKVDINSIDGVIISSVVPQLTAVIREASKKIVNPDSPIYTVGPGIKTGLNIKVDDTSQLGSDIVANTVAAIAVVQKAPMIIIDAGTATTITAVDKNQTMTGTIIIPGIRISLDALVNSAAMIPFVSIDEKRSNFPVIGKNTQESIVSGIINGHSFIIDGFIAKIRSESGMENASVIATGGLANVILYNCKEKTEIYPNLTLFGLMKIYDLNRKKKNNPR